MLLPSNNSFKDQNFAKFLDDAIRMDYTNLNIDPLTCDISLLPHLALEKGADIDLMTELEVREYIKLFERKPLGTLGAVEDVAKVHFKNPKIVEWFEDKTLKKGMFRLDVELESTKRYGIDLFTSSARIINKSKNVRSKLDSFNLKLETKTKDILMAHALVSNIALKNKLDFEQAKTKINLSMQAVSNIALKNKLNFEQAKTEINLKIGGVLNKNMHNILPFVKSKTQINLKGAVVCKI